MVNQFKERLPHSGLYNLVNWIAQGPLPECWNDDYLWQIRIHASVKQLGHPVSISMILKYDSSSDARKQQFHVKESDFEICCSEAKKQ